MQRNRKDTKHYVEYQNHDPNWLKMIIIEIDKFLIYCEYIKLFMQVYMQWIKENGSTSSYLTLSLLCLPRI